MMESDAIKKRLESGYGLCITKKWYNVRDSYVKSMKPGYLGSRRNRPYIHSDLLRYFEKIKRKCSSTQQAQSKKTTQKKLKQNHGTTKCLSA
ncbi:hypothetical protein MSG28_015676 [Choristoneura fumiferana]|uniref:Uncharacterized protein n=1 Tax=Choristoneura fumiferana TaxID=7141 RepID=A0ACC0KB30_CHOFU|nr:hypothetical protein MSG28_015676 [Choristoneura fumiferana]